MRSGSRKGRRQLARAHGFTYVVALFVLAITSVAAASFATVYSTEMKRRKEVQLLRLGDEIRRAIGEYYRRSPGAVPRYPQSLDDLLEDRRYLSLQRYMRRIAPDPMTGQAQWGTVVAPGGGIMGVHSLSTKHPIKRARFGEGYGAFAAANSYQDWKFVYIPPPASATSPGGKPQR